jgi:cytoskeletal protein RodZ
MVSWTVPPFSGDTVVCSHLPALHLLVVEPYHELVTLTQNRRLSSHYQWVIFLVIMVVAIVGIWVGACVWRKRYLRNRDRQYALGTNLAHATESGRVIPNSGNPGDLQAPGAGMFDPAPISSAGVYNEKPKKEKKKWVVKHRT